MRYFDRIIRRGLAAAEGLQDPARLLAAAAAQFRHGDGNVQPVYDLTGMTLQQTFIGSRESILGEMADHFKQRRSHFVVEVLGEKFLLLRTGESHADIR